MKNPRKIGHTVQLGNVDGQELPADLLDENKKYKAVNVRQLPNGNYVADIVPACLATATEAARDLAKALTAAAEAARDAAKAFEAFSDQAHAATPEASTR